MMEMEWVVREVDPPEGKYEEVDDSGVWRSVLSDYPARDKTWSFIL